MMIEEKTTVKDFVGASYSDAIQTCWEFFNDNQHFRLIRYESIDKGIRAHYIVVH